MLPLALAGVASAEGDDPCVRGTRAVGKIRSWGLSNFDAGELDEALAIAGPGHIACDQVLCHLDERAAETSVLPWCARHGAAFVAYSPFGAGRFPSEKTARGRVLADVARERGATPRQVALAFLVRDPASLAIPKAARVEHVVEIAGAGELVLARTTRCAASMPRSCGLRARAVAGAGESAGAPRGRAYPSVA